MRLSRCGLLLFLCLIIMVGARLAAPSALQRFDQPKTVSYTADIVENGRFLMPRDAMGNPATKPPLVNWLAAPLVALGFWTEWAAKMPMLLASLATLAMTIWMARRIFRRLPEMEGEDIARDAAWLAGIAWLVNPANLTMVYHCRPDPVLVMFMTGAWILGTIIICEHDQPSTSVVVGFWVCVGLAALTKGPAALAPMLFIPLASRLIRGKWSHANRSRWWWGLPLAMGLLLAWAIPCMIYYPEPFWKNLVGREMIAQAAGLGSQFDSKRSAITSDGPIAALRLIHENPQWFMEKFAPWSVLAVAGLIVIGWRRWLRHPLAPAILWVFLIVVFFALSAHKTADYILPSYPAAAMLAAYFCVTLLRRRFRVQPWHVAAAGVCVAIGLGINAMFFSASAEDRTGEHLKTFAKQARAMVHDDPVVFWKTGDNTVQFFMHHHQGGEPGEAEIMSARWFVMPEQADLPAELRSEPIITKQSKRLRLALYRADAVRPRLVASK